MRLARVVFAGPIPVPYTHQRVQDFSEADGWEITDDGGVLWFSRGTEPRWYTREPASCVPKPEPKPALATATKGRR